MEDQDSLWKEALEEFFEPFLQLLFPGIHESVDWGQPIRFLDKELQKLRLDSRTGRRQVDKLVEVHFCDGAPRWLLIHVEVQGYHDRRFAERMFTYYHRLRDHYGKSVVSLAVLTDIDPNFRPAYFEERIKGKGIRFDFHSVKLLDYQAHWEALLQSDNPFALLVAAQLMVKLEPDEKRRVDSLITFYRLALRHNLSKEKIARLISFLEWLVALPPEIEAYYTAGADRFKEENTMPYVSILERVSEERGHQRGRQEGRQAQLLRLLQLKFGEFPDELRQRVENAGETELDHWAERLLFVANLEAVFEDPIG
ncbi:MAG TPA: DUF4351 domain-containing protein [Hyphomicrobiales bacterium]|nr:DUF4351 domain-containing protein [Hyphomicrobiales bacterium]